MAVWFEDPTLFVAIIVPLVTGLGGIFRKGILWGLVGILVATVGYVIDSSLWFAWFGLVLLNLGSLVYSVLNFLR